MTVVMLAGGIDLSVGSNFALANLTALALINVAKWPVEAAVAATLGVGALVGLVNGLLIGFLQAAGVPDDARHADADSRDRRVAAADLFGADRFERRGVDVLGLYRRRLGCSASPVSFVVLVVDRDHRAVSS